MLNFRDFRKQGIGRDNRLVKNLRTPEVNTIEDVQRIIPCSQLRSSV